MTVNMASSIEEPEFPCGLCKKNNSESHAAIQCDACTQWFHAHCKNISAPQYAAYSSLQSFSWLCMECGSPNYSSLPSESLVPLPVSNIYNSLDCSDSKDETDNHSTQFTPNSHRPAENSFSPGSNTEMPLMSTLLKKNLH